MSEIDALKSELRKELKIRREKMKKNEKIRLDKLILENISRCKAFRNAETVLIYKSTNIETGTEMIIDYCFSENKKIALPRCSKGHRMDFYFYTRGDELEISRYGIAEPYENEYKKVTYFNNCICIVPGLSFDRNGYRLGYGGGYYDRFLAANNVLSLGICYEAFISETLPKDNFDYKIDFLVTENFLEGYNGK